MAILAVLTKPVRAGIEVAENMKAERYAEQD